MFKFCFKLSIKCEMWNIHIFIHSFGIRLTWPINEWFFFVLCAFGVLVFEFSFIVLRSLRHLCVLISSSGNRQCRCYSLGGVRVLDHCSIFQFNFNYVSFVFLFRSIRTAGLRIVIRRMTLEMSSRMCKTCKVAAKNVNDWRAVTRHLF